MSQDQVLPANYNAWIRLRFPMLNKSIDQGNAEALRELSLESADASRAMASDIGTDENERFTYISMIHAALYHHKNAAQTLVCEEIDESLRVVEQDLIKMASDLGVEHRFLSSFYLMYNLEIPANSGKFAQFRPSEYETSFIRINREGTLQYKHAALSLIEACELMQSDNSSHESLRSLFEQAAAEFRSISQGNAQLMRTPGSEEFRFLTKYFGEVCVAGGPPLRGVNAGDQPWSYIIDLLLGVDLKRAFETAFKGTPKERHYPSYVRRGADVIYFELKSRQYLRDNYLLPDDYQALKKTLGDIGHAVKPLPESILEVSSPKERGELAEKLLQVLRNYIGASNVHFALAKKFVPRSSTGEQIGSAGTNIKKFLLHGLNDERVKVRMALEEHYPEFVEKNQNAEQTRS